MCPTFSLVICGVAGVALGLGIAKVKNSNLWTLPPLYEGRIQAGPTGHRLEVNQKYICDIQSGGFSAQASSSDLGEPSGPAYLRSSKPSRHFHFNFSIIEAFHHHYHIFYLSIASLGFLVSGIILAWSCAGLAGDHSLSLSSSILASLVALELDPTPVGH